MVTLRVMANSRKSRPTMSPMKNSGTKTAISEMVSEMIVNPIVLILSRLPQVARLPPPCSGRRLNHHDGVIHHKARRDRQGHQGQVIQAVAGKIHHRKRTHK